MILMKKKTVLKKIQHSRKLLKALDNLTQETKTLEERFSDELYLFFQYLGSRVLDEININQPLETVFYQNVNDTINKYWKEYDDILSYYVDRASVIGLTHYDILLEASKQQAESIKSKRQFLDNKLEVEEEPELYMPNPKVSTKLERYKFEASEKTKSRVTNEINNILSEGYREGWGPRHVAEKIQDKFTNLKTYEARRIAQTEINTTRNFVQFQQLQEDGMEYKIWHSAHDSRTRKSHLDVDEEIVPIDQPFSNGLMYPGDKTGPIEEWINCRCSHAAYIIPLGYEAPNFFPFTESDLVKVGSSISQDYVPQIQEKLRLLEGAMIQQTRDSPVRQVVRYEELIIGIYNPEWSKNKKQE